jgi:nucleoside-diphosphate-sugar epimerase
MAAVAITGASGFVGGHLARRLAAEGWSVIRLVRRPDGPGEVAYDLRGDPPRDALAGVDVLVHAAYVKGEEEVNVDGTARLLEAARSVGVPRAIFVSSLSARPDAVAAYGRQKHAAEALFDGAADAVVRAGLVIGDGGLVGETVRFLRRRHVLPLIDGGRQPVQPVGVDDLVTAIARIAADLSLRGTFTVADPRPRTMREVYATIAREQGVRVALVPVPFWAPLLAVRAAARLGMRLGITEDNLRGLRQARAVETAADLERLGLTLEPLETLARRLVV